jgi:Ca2+-binding EF-hand superfamily protein
MKPSHLLFALPILLSTAAVAQGPGGGGPPKRIVLEALDTDGDGQLSAAEIAAASQSLLKLDKNGDGQITSAEYSPRLEDKTAISDLEQRLMLLDKNGDGVLTADEVPERMKPLFERGDTNHDGKLTRDEIAALSGKQADPQGRPVGRGNFNSMDPIMIALDVDKDGILSATEIANASVALKTLDKDGDGTLSAAELRMRQQTPRQRAEHLFDEWDTNKDGALIKEEMPDRMQAQFEAIDTNHDGKVDMDEATAYMEKQPQGRGPGAPAAGQRSQGEGQPRP